MMQHCLRHVSGLEGARIVDSQFLWTEPHSRRIRLQLQLEWAGAGSAMLRQTFIITFLVGFTQCPDCRERATPREHWTAKVQVRQTSPHRRTLMWLEQQILRHRAHVSSSGIERKDGGVDFQFTEKPAAQRLVNFFKNFLPVDVVASEHLAGEDLQCGTKDMRFTFSVRVPPLNRQDLVALPPDLIRKTGNQSVVMVVHKIAKTIRLVDPASARVVDVEAQQFWHNPFEPLLDVSSLRRFVVLTVDPVGPKAGKFQLADVELTDEETYSDRVLVRTHLGGCLWPDKACLAYDLRMSVIPEDLARICQARQVPDVIIVGRANETKARMRPWHLKELAPRLDEVEQRDFDEFLGEVEVDPELRADLELYRNPGIGETSPELQASLIKLSEMKVDPDEVMIG